MLTEVANELMFFEKSMMTTLSSGIGPPYTSPSNDVLERLRLVKSYTDLVVSFASDYAERTGKPFSEMLRVGLIALIKSTRTNCMDVQRNYNSYIMGEIDNAMSDFCKKSS